MEKRCRKYCPDFCTNIFRSIKETNQKIIVESSVSNVSGAVSLISGTVDCGIMKACAANSTLLAQARCSATTHTLSAQRHTFGSTTSLQSIKTTCIRSMSVMCEIKALQFIFILKPFFFFF